MDDVNEAQRLFWTDTVGADWVGYDAVLERVHGAFNSHVFDAAELGQGQRVLDIGCGTGATTRQAATLLGRDGRITGLDISSVMLSGARSKSTDQDAAPISYLEADAQVHDFDLAAYDRIISRMGVMFFADPVAAFANLRRAAAPGARFAAIAWRRGEDNPWFGIGAEVMTAHFGPPEPVDPTAPGPMAFADKERVEGLMRHGGWDEARVTPCPVTLKMEGGPELVAGIMEQTGPASRRLKDTNPDKETRAAIHADLVAAIAPYATGSHVEIPVVMNLLTAFASE